MIRHLFVYGTLRSSETNPAARRLHGHAELIGPGHVQGALYGISWYPGLILEGQSRVYGELFRLDNPEEILPELDAYEGAEFERVILNVSASGETTPAWAYVYRLSVAGKRRVESGIWTGELS